MRDDPIDRADAKFIAWASGLKTSAVTAAMAEARIPEAPEIHEQFELASRKLLKTLSD